MILHPPSFLIDLGYHYHLNRSKNCRYRAPVFLKVESTFTDFRIFQLVGHELNFTKSPPRSHLNFSYCFQTTTTSISTADDFIFLYQLNSPRHLLLLSLLQPYADRLSRKPIEFCHSSSHKTL